MIGTGATTNRRGAPRRGRSGFALIFVLVFMLLLMTLLIAAQGAVVTSTRLIQRSADRMSQAEMTADLLSLAIARLGVGEVSNEATPTKAESGGVRAIQTFRRLQSNDPLYPTLPGLAHREGDALVSIAYSGKGGEETWNFLVNTIGKRTGAIRIR